MHDKENVVLVDLAVPPPGAERRRVADIAFEGCTITGPVTVIAPDVTGAGPQFIVQGNAYFRGQEEEAFRVLTGGEDFPDDAIVIDNSRFTNCTFDGVVFMGTELQVNALRNQFSVS
jgi:hypothetical protein